MSSPLYPSLLPAKSPSPCSPRHPSINFDETELRLGLPARRGVEKAATSAAEVLKSLINGKRGFSETEIVDLKLHLSNSSTTGIDEKDKVVTPPCQVNYSESKSCPFILFVKHVEKSIVANSDSYSAFNTRLDRLPSNVVVIGFYTQSDNRKEKSHP